MIPQPSTMVKIPLENAGSDVACSVAGGDVDMPLQIRSHRRAQWFWIDNEIWDTYGEKIGPIGLALYIGLCRYANHKTGQCWPSLTTLARHAGVSVLSVSRHLKVLVKYRLIHLDARPGTTACITILDIPRSPITELGVPQSDPHPTEGGPPSQVNTPPITGLHEPDSPNQTKERTSNPSDDRSARGERKPKSVSKDETSSWDKRGTVPVWTGEARLGEEVAMMELRVEEKAVLNVEVRAIIEAQPLKQFIKSSRMHFDAVKECLLLALKSGCAFEEAREVAARYGVETAPCAARVA